MYNNNPNKEIPTGWRNCLITDFCNLNMGQSPPSTTYNQNGEGLPFYQGKSEFGDVYPTPVKYCSRPNKIANAGDILISVRAPVGPTNISPHKACIGRGLAAIRPLSGIPTKFVLFLIRCYESEISKFGTGTTFKAITKDNLSNLFFNLPPLPEQYRIVDKIEELFSDLDNAIESLKKAKEQLKTYRQAVLKWAFEGKLTEEWRKQNNPESAEKLLEIIKEEREKHYKKSCEAATNTSQKKPRRLDTSYIERNKPTHNLPNSWIWCCIKDIFSELTDYHANGSYKRLKSIVTLVDMPSYAMMIRTTNLERNNFDSNLKYIYEDAYNFLSRSKLFGNEILIGKIGNAGKIYYMPELKKPASLAMNLFLLRFKHVNPKFIYYHLISKFSKNDIAQYVKGVGNPTIDKKSIRSLLIALPPVEEQNKIIEEIESRLSVCDNIESNIEETLSKADALRQSILKKAFEGKLVPQDPNDESASELLDKIKAEKEDKQKRIKL